MEQHRVDALVPGGALADQRAAEPDLAARVGDMGRWNPRLRQGAGAQQFTEVVGVSANAAGWPWNRPSQACSSSRLAGLSCPRRVSPVSVSRVSKVIWRRWMSS